MLSGTAKQNLQKRCEEAEVHLLALRKEPLVKELANAKVAVAETAFTAGELQVTANRDSKRCEELAVRLLSADMLFAYFLLVRCGSALSLCSWHCLQMFARCWRSLP
jgi:hypothetical protein